MNKESEGVLFEESLGGSVDAISKIELPFRVDQSAEAVPDGRVDTEDRDRYIFSGVGSCIPIVIRSVDGGRIFAAIHANTQWSPERLRYFMDRASPGCITEYLEHVSTHPIFGEIIRESSARAEMLVWLKNTQTSGRYSVRRTALVSSEGVVHVVFDKHEGWKEVVFS